MKKVFSLLLSLMIVMSLAVPAAATENLGILTFLEKNDENTFTCSPGISNATDLFDEGFKNVMPGDKIVGYVHIKGNFNSFHEDSLKVWMRAIPHSDDGNAPITPGTGDVAYMNDFLNELSLRVYNMSDGDKEIFRGQADELDGLRENVYLGSFRKNGKIVLRVELDVPITLGNEFAHRVGEVDWLFTVEAFDDPSYDNPKTGDYIMMAVAGMAVSAAALIVILAVKRKKKK